MICPDTSLEDAKTQVCFVHVDFSFLGLLVLCNGFWLLAVSVTAVAVFLQEEDLAWMEGLDPVSVSGGDGRTGP